MKVLGCGGRKYPNYARVREVLDAIAPTHIVHGAATGADSLVGRYARENSIPCNAFPAQWEKKDPVTGRIYIDKGAGFDRNKKMLLTSQPDLVIAFPGGNGTKHMVKFAKDNGYRVIVIPDTGPCPYFPENNTAPVPTLNHGPDISREERTTIITGNDHRRNPMPTQDKPKAETGGDPPGNGQENDQDTAPPGPRPTSNVYHLYFTTGELPEANADKAQFAREYLSNLIPDTPDGITYYLQHQNQEDEYLLTIIVPNRLTSTVSQLESSGFQPSFTEPEHPYIEDNSFVVPRSLQVLRIGALIDPLTASNNPQYMWELSSMLQDNVKDPPHHALDINNWTNIYIDDDTGTALISWTPFDEDQQEQ